MPVYRAPMRSRRDDVDPQPALDRAFALGLCGFGDDRADRSERRVQRFAAAPDGSFVWTRDGDGWYWLGRIDGPYFYDAGGADVDLVHVRPCRWRTDPVTESRCPPAVFATVGRGGRNFQQVHDAHMGDESLRLWQSV